MRPILIGMNNPLSLAPGHELYPHPPGCTGHRLWSMLNERLPIVTRRRYLDTFERRNLVVGTQYDKRIARASASLIYAELWGSGRVVVLLGNAVRDAFGDVPPLLLHPQLIGGCTWRQIPHPSGRNLWYNVPENRKLVGVLLEELYAAYNRERVNEDTQG